MAWFRNHYVCLACEGHWLAEHAEATAADCPFCRAYDVAPYKSDDRTPIVEVASALPARAGRIETSLRRLRKLDCVRERKARAG